MPNSFSLIGFLGLDTKQFERGLQSSKGKADQFAKQVGGGGEAIGNMLGNLGTKLVGALAVGKLASEFKQAAEWAKELNKEAAEVGMTGSAYNDLSRTIKRLSLADEGAINKAITALSVLRSKVLEGGDEGEKAAAKLKKVGVSMDTLKSGDMEAAFSEISAHIKAAGGTSMEVIAGMREVFGKMGPKLIPAFAKDFGKELEKTKEGFGHFEQIELDALAGAGSKINKGSKWIGDAFKHLSATVATVVGNQGEGRDVWIIRLLAGLTGNAKLNRFVAAKDAKEAAEKKAARELDRKQAEEILDHKKKVEESQEAVRQAERALNFAQKAKEQDKGPNVQRSREIMGLEMRLRQLRAVRDELEGEDAKAKTAKDEGRKDEEKADTRALRVLKLRQEVDDKRKSVAEDEMEVQDRYLEVGRELAALHRKLYMDEEDRLRNQLLILDKTKEHHRLEKEVNKSLAERWKNEMMAISKNPVVETAKTGMFPTMAAFLASQVGAQYDRQNAEYLRMISSNTSWLVEYNRRGIQNRL